MADSNAWRTITTNRAAYHNYFVDETYEAGIVLVGTEVKSLRMGQINLKDSYADILDGEIFLIGTHISPYEKGNIFNRQPERRRKLLMHKREILKLSYAKAKDGYTIVPLSLYFSGRNVKVKLGVCRGKRFYDKRDDVAARDAKRRALRGDD